MTKVSEIREFGFEDLAKALFTASGISDVLWHLGVKLRLGGITAGWGEEDGNVTHMPTGLVGIEAVALTPAVAPGPMVFDAAKLYGAKLSKTVKPAAKRITQVARKAAPKH